MPQPDEVAELAEQLIRLFTEAQESLTDQLTRAATDSSRARLRELQAAVNASLDSLEQGASSWFSDEMPAIYELGGVDGAASIDDAFSWSQFHVDAVQELAQQTYGEVLEATTFVRQNVKAWVREQARARTRSALLEGRTAQHAARELTRDALAREVFGIRYRNGARHTIADYADTLIRTTSANAYNAGTLNHLTQAGVGWVEVIDGSDCGWTSHDDGDKANGTVRRVQEAMRHSLSHPRCRRSFAGRTDVTSDEQAAQARSLRSAEQLADQAAAEAVRAAGMASGAARRRAATPRPQRAARTPRSSTPAPRQRRAPRSAPRSTPLPDAPTRSVGPRPTLEKTSTRRPPKLDDLLNDFAPGESVLERMRPVFERRYGPINVELDNARRTVDGIVVQGRIWDGGEHVGLITREITEHADGTRSVYNALLTLDRRYQGQGFVTAYFDELDVWYRANGIAWIDVHADIDVGGYTWARKGFGWREGPDGSPSFGTVPADLGQEISRMPAGELRDEAQGMLDRLTDPAVHWTPDMPTPLDISNLGKELEDEPWLGKRALLNSDWLGRRYL